MTPLTEPPIPGSAPARPAAETADTIEALQARVERAEKASRWESDLCGQALANNKALQARIAELEADAARYRWLRNHALSVDWSRPIGGDGVRFYCRTGGESMDAAIDAAMKG